MKNLRVQNSNSPVRKSETPNSAIGGQYNNILTTYRQHTFLAIGLIVLTSIITLFVVAKNLNTYKNSCQSTFIYYKNGSSVLVSNIENKSNK